MTRNEKIALGIGAGVVVFGGLTIYFLARTPSASAQLTPSPQPQPTPPPSTSPSSFAPTTTPTPESTPASRFPPSWNQFTSVVAGHRYKITLTSATPFNWFTKVNPNAIPGSFVNIHGYGVPTATEYSYTLDATVSHQVQNAMFLLGLTDYVDVTVTDIGAAT